MDSLSKKKKVTPGLPTIHSLPLKLSESEIVISISGLGN
jgi:hypothetical protein